MTTFSLPDTTTPAEAGREFWRAVLLAGGPTAIPRWTLDPVSGVGEHEALIRVRHALAVRRFAGQDAHVVLR